MSRLEPANDAFQMSGAVQSKGYFRNSATMRLHVSSWSSQGPGISPALAASVRRQLCQLNAQRGRPKSVLFASDELRGWP